jgi:ribosome-associated translation inhibitor RaiA
MQHPQAKAVSSLLYKFQMKGIKLISVYDGGEAINVSQVHNLFARKEAVDAITSVDESWVKIEDAVTKDKAQLYIVLGNDNSEILCDYSASSEEFFHRIDSIADKFYQQWSEAIIA